LKLKKLKMLAKMAAKMAAQNFNCTILEFKKFQNDKQIGGQDDGSKI